MNEKLRTDSTPTPTGEPHNSTDLVDPLDPLDAMLRRGLAEQLDGHLGCAAERFMVASKPRAVPTTSVSAFRLWWAAPLLAAAAAVAMFAAPMFRAGKPSRADPSIAVHPSTGLPAHHANDSAPLASRATDSVPTPVSYEPTEVGGAVKWADRYEGMVWLDDETPAKKIRRHRLETLEWTDPSDSSRIQISLPREEIVLVSSPKL